MSKLNWIQDEITKLKTSGLLTSIRELDSAQGAWLQVDGKKVLNFCSNNYLGLANHPRLVEAAKKALDNYGAGPAAVRTIAGTMKLHTELEERIAAFKKTDAAITFQSGYNANIAVIPALMGNEDIIFSDELNHASIIDGCRLSGARVVRYNHCDSSHLNSVITENAGNYSRAMVISDGVFSMDGDIAPLDQLFEVASQHKLMLMVDDAHGEGVLGKGGRGIVDHYNLNGEVDVEIGTFSKAFGVIGGVAAGKRLIIDWLKQRGRPFLFSSAMTPADVSACIEAINILEESTELVDRLWDNTKYFKTRMAEAGFDTGNSETPITPIMLGEAGTAQEFSKMLFENGVFATAIGYPTVPRGKARIRVMVSAAHSREDLDKGLAIFTATANVMGLI